MYESGREYAGWLIERPGAPGLFLSSLLCVCARAVCLCFTNRCSWCAPTNRRKYIINSVISPSDVRGGLGRSERVDCLPADDGQLVPSLECSFFTIGSMFAPWILTEGWEMDGRLSGYVQKDEIRPGEGGAGGTQNISDFIFSRKQHEQAWLPATRFYFFCPIM